MLYFRWQRNLYQDIKIRFSLNIEVYNKYRCLLWAGDVELYSIRAGLYIYYFIFSSASPVLIIKISQKEGDLYF